MSEQRPGPAEALYMKLLARRDPQLQRARLASRYTIPQLLPPEGSTSGTDLYIPFQALAARCVKNLASKIVLTTLPPTRRSFRLIIDEVLQRRIPPDQVSEWELALSRIEADIEKKIESLGIRTKSFEAFCHLIVAGNVLFYISEEMTRYFPMSQYVVTRGPNGKVKHLVLCEMLDPDDLTEDMIPLISAEDALKDKATSEKRYKLYTHVHLEGNRYVEYQEICGVEIPGTRGSYDKDESPWHALRWSASDEGDWSRSHADEYIGDIIASESLSRSVIRTAAVMAKTVFLVNPNGLTRPEDCESAEEGGFVYGLVDDVGPLGADKAQELSVTRAVLEDINSRLSYAFLLNSAVRRQGERVTAEEIRFLASELEDTVGGVYSVLSTEFQLPIVRNVLALMTKAGTIPDLPDKSVRPTIITGIDALGRSHELARLDAFISGPVQMFGPEVLGYVHVAEYLKRRAAGLDIMPGGLIKTDEERAQEQQAAVASTAMEKLGPSAIKAVSDNMIADKQAASAAPTESVNGQ